MDAQVVNTDDLSLFKSPLRILVRSFRRSRDKWKQKYMGLKCEIKRFRNQAADARRSREQWKTKAEGLLAEVRRLERELDQFRFREAAATDQKTSR